MKESNKDYPFFKTLYYFSIYICLSEAKSVRSDEIIRIAFIEKI